MTRQCVDGVMKLARPKVKSQKVSGGAVGSGLAAPRGDGSGGGGGVGSGAVGSGRSGGGSSGGIGGAEASNVQEPDAKRPTRAAARAQEGGGEAAAERLATRRQGDMESFAPRHLHRDGKASWVGSSSLMKLEVR